MNNPELFDFVRKKLSRLYASFKNYEGVIRFLFLTGITKFNKTSIFSELNTLTDISLSPRYGSLLGYTHEEVVEYFKDYVNSRTLSCPRKSSYVPVCQLVKGIYLFK